ncbi:3-deoxy-manno-octulosonate cytidylyltransferase [Mucilaginibacter sp. RS28]|uniref:3-deoxy-manno-octulosonate cytidylyltransferase n=1 Tax=Mucilaginibacter straminoryzae TaxID=2932774 RepID=A0A9X1X4I5_9SPHI|nr:3-deoxy-manno-octulosonate cytidylyltransferase [Mucilaginibacter straminoryzae]MCJ8210894.1 3-deoxy-manno-octulosonate cytidylyltransferase [Mucilaginibacter straminoryzae]
MNILGIIPTRYASTRFPGKPLIMLDGKSMIQRVYEQAKKCTAITEVVVATDDERIFSHVQEFGGKVVMTASDHQSGTDRCAEVAASHPEYDVVINIQGDEPYIDPEQLSKVAACFTDETVQIATLIKKITRAEELFNPNAPKVIINKFAEAIYFSRSPIPHVRGEGQADWLYSYTYFKHIGVYAYRSDILQEITKLPVSSLEKAESLEQLRWIENGYRIKVAETELETVAIDTPDDLKKLNQK